MLAKLEIANKQATLFISGELDQTYLKDDYWAKLDEQQAQQLQALGSVEVNLSEVKRADTAGLAWLINFCKDSKSHKVQVKFIGVPDKLLNLADLSSARGIIDR